MGWRMRIQHTTSYQYATPAHASYNEARLSPLDIPTQFTIEHRLETTPAAPMLRYRDYWGTRVHAFDIHRPHEGLVVTSTSTVETSGAQKATTEALAWDQLDADTIGDRYCELLTLTPLVDSNDEIAAVAERLRSAPAPVIAVVQAVEWVRDRLEYQRGSTSVQTKASEAHASGRGVCQDFVHLGLSLLRQLGIPARYVSGYVHPQQQATLGEAVAGESHAWLEAWLGDWRALDPTSGAEVGERHVVVARGRDYTDVPPLKGVYHGGQTRETQVAVQITRLA